MEEDKAKKANKKPKIDGDVEQQQKDLKKKKKKKKIKEADTPKDPDGDESLVDKEEVSTTTSKPKSKTKKKKKTTKSQGGGSTTNSKPKSKTKQTLNRHEEPLGEGLEVFPPITKTSIQARRDGSPGIINRKESVSPVREKPQLKDPRRPNEALDASRIEPVQANPRNQSVGLEEQEPKIKKKKKQKPLSSIPRSIPVYTPPPPPRVYNLSELRNLGGLRRGGTLNGFPSGLPSGI
jgi:hypothetical protein